MQKLNSRKYGNILNFDGECAILRHMKNFRIVKYQIPVDKKKYCSAERLRIVLLSDLHNQRYGRKNEILVREIDRLKPDLVAAAGDMFTPEEGRTEHVALNLMETLAERYPVCYGIGNHEYIMKLDTDFFGVRYERYARGLRKAGVLLLENEYADITLKGLPIRIYGLQIPWRFYRRFSYRRLSVEEMKKYLGTGTQERYKILLAHNPMCFSAYEKWGADLTLSGHLHGGFIRPPLLGGVISPQCVPFPKYDRGIFEKNGHYLAVSAGLGSHANLPRLGNPAELVLLELIPQSKAPFW